MVWHIQRLDSNPTIPAVSPCDAGFVHTGVTLKDDATGEVVVTTFCNALNPERACQALANLTTAGFTPNDWDGPCGA